ncbi:Fe-S cluster assembly protein SufD [Arthrospiribacter ruber]|uniref:Fe-S cluster assembly protein SufD n=1 Tax=Arthrospiribacter ruber TaxID=2487934 RepID=A0A951ITW8_9BACT|nr:Fe-S cluster assembly protein SufD [Arthrospiribacter ruber]MBW3467265.1 Fe-S cluster assembly protein SufD [Arthrospiribacter ruber]
MASATQIDHLELLLGQDSSSSFPEMASSAREQALAAGLPAVKEEEYKFTAIQRKIEKSISDFGRAKVLELTPEQVAAALPEGFDGDYIVFNNGIPELNLSSFGQEGYTATLLSGSRPEKLGKVAKNEKDVFTAINTASFIDGLHIEVAKNQQIEKPIHFLFFNQSNSGQVINSRILIEVEANAEISFLENTVSVNDESYFLNQVTEVIAAPNSKSSYSRLQNESNQAITVNNFETDIHRDAVFTSNVISLGGDMVRNNLTLNLLDSGCEGNMYGLYLLNGKTHVDNHTNVDHTKPHAESNELYKGILADSSRGVFNGKIFVRQDAQKTNAFQQNNNILLSEDATINTKPQLEIWADDVKCSHGCTTGQLDEEALFYLQARGLGKDQAKGLMLYAFAGEVLEHIPDEAFRNHADALVKERLGTKI